MGITASLKAIQIDLFERWIAGSEENSGGPGESIDKAWSEFHKVFASLGSPLSLAITGDHRHPVCPQTYDEFRAGEHEIYLGLVSPELVREIAEALSKLTLEEYKRRDFELHGEDFCFGDTYLTTLKAVYANAASQGNAIVVLIC